LFCGDDKHGIWDISLAGTPKCLDRLKYSQEEETLQERNLKVEDLIQLIRTTSSFQSEPSPNLGMMRMFSHSLLDEFDETEVETEDYSYEAIQEEEIPRGQSGSTDDTDGGVSGGGGGGGVYDEGVHSTDDTDICPDSPTGSTRSAGSMTTGPKVFEFALNQAEIQPEIDIVAGDPELPTPPPPPKTIKCSACENPEEWSSTFRFCPYCGAPNSLLGQQVTKLVLGTKLEVELENENKIIARSNSSVYEGFVVTCGIRQEVAIKMIRLPETTERMTETARSLANETRALQVVENL